MKARSPLLQKFLSIYFIALLVGIALTIANQKLWNQHIPRAAIQWIWLILFACYGPLIWASVREDQISIPPQIIWRNDRPVFFWIVVATNVVYWIAGTSIMAYSIFN
jgi:hypothetical protein